MKCDVGCFLQLGAAKEEGEREGEEASAFEIYHAHRVLLPDGAVFVLEKTDAELSTASMLSVEAQQRLPNSSASNTSIPQNSEKSTPETDFSFEGKTVDKYTEEQYNNFGWVREEGVLSAGQMKDFERKFASAKTGQGWFPKAQSGEYMIAVSDIYGEAEGVENTIVYASGEMEAPKISKF